MFKDTFIEKKLCLYFAEYLNFRDIKLNHFSSVLTSILNSMDKYTTYNENYTSIFFCVCTCNCVCNVFLFI